MPWTPPFQPTELVARLWLMIENIRLWLGVRGAKEHALGLLMLRVSTYLGRLHGEVESLVTAIREGRIAPLGLRASGRRRGPARSGPVRKSRRRPMRGTA